MFQIMPYHLEQQFRVNSKFLLKFKTFNVILSFNDSLVNSSRKKIVCEHGKSTRQSAWTMNSKTQDQNNTFLKYNKQVRGEQWVLQIAQCHGKATKSWLSRLLKLSHVFYECEWYCIGVYSNFFRCKSKHNRKTKSILTIGNRQFSSN